MDTSTAPLARVRSNRAMISAVRHRSHCIRETVTAPELLLAPLQGEQQGKGNEVQADEEAIEHTEPTVVKATDTVGVTVADADAATTAAATVDLSKARPKEEDDRSAGRLTRRRPISARCISIGKRQRTASLSSSSSSSSSLILSSPDDATTDAPSGFTSNYQFKPRLTKKAKFDDNDNSATAQTTVVSSSLLPSTTTKPKSRLFKKRTIRRRTETSYDEDTTNYLKRVFFEVYGHGRKLSKVERRAIEADTGLMSRKITYWFSNQKRRFSAELKAFQRLSNQGCIKTYDDFLIWCKENHVPELVPRPLQREDDEDQQTHMFMDDSAISLQCKELLAFTHSP